MIKRLARDGASAVISDDYRYRYRLDRSLYGEGLTLAFIGINPSTADALVDDQTIRKLHVFAKQEGAFRFVVGNVFALRATNVLELAGATDPIGPKNSEHLYAIFQTADILVPIWGNRSKVPPRLRPQIAWTRHQLAASGKPLMCFGRTLSGDPCHPLMLPYATRLKEFVP